ncbi:RNA polymerase sigma factor [Flavitalea flava]
MNDQPKDLLKNWQLLADGDKEGLYNCFHQFYDDLYRFGISRYRNRELAREGIHDLFIELWRIHAKLSHVRNMQEYVLSIYKRILYKSYKKLQKGNLTETSFPEELSQESYETILIQNQEENSIKEKLYKVLNQLSPRQKEIIQLRYYEQVSIKDIAEKTSLTERTVYNTLYAALQVFRETMIVILFCSLF